MEVQLTKKSKFVCLAMTFAMVLGLFLTAGTSVYASSYEQKTNNPSGLLNLRAKFDPYIQVRNNQYVLNIPTNFNSSKSEIDQVNQALQNANNIVEINHETINPSTKIVKDSSLLQRASGYTSSSFWWGVRYYFRSNYAVYQMDHDLDNYSIMVGLTGLWAPPVAALGAAYFQKVKSDLDYYNNTHINDKINMDVTSAGAYFIYSV